MNPPFTQGPPSESIVTLSSDDEVEQASANINAWGNHLIRNPPNLLRMAEENEVYSSGNSTYIGTNVRVTHRLRTPTTQAPSTVTSPLDLNQSISTDQQIIN